MKKNRFLISCISFLTLSFFLSCGKSEAATVDFLEIPHNEVTFWPEMGEKVVEINSNTDLEVESMGRWCKAEMVSNQRNKIRLVVEKNDEVGVDRFTEVIVSAQEITKKIKVKQLSEDPKIDILEKNIYFNDNQNRIFSLTISSNLDYSIEVPQWIEKVKVESVNNVTKRHFFVAQLLSPPNSERNDKIFVKFDNQDLVEDIAISIVQSNKKSEFSMATYNILVGSWQDRKELVYRIIEMHDFDIWGTQEGTLVHLTDITNQFDEYDYIGTGRDGENNGEFSAILYKTDRFEVLDKGNFWYSNTPEKPSYGWDATNYRRICTWGKFRDKDTQNSFYLFNSHFDHQGVVARKESAKLLLSMIKSIVKPGYPVFVTGDLNCQPDSEPIDLIKAEGLLFDSKNLANDPIGSEGTFNSLKPNETSTIRIDYVFITKEVDLKQYKVINDRPDGKCPSDHDPVYIIVEF